MYISTRLGMFLILFIGGFSLIAYLVELDKLVRFDHQIIVFVQGFETDFLTTFMKLLSLIGSTPSVIVISLIAIVYLYKVLHHRKELTLLVITITGSTVLNVILKLIFQRARPEINQIISEDGYSFPSGHSMAALSLYGMLTFLLWRHIQSKAGRGALLIINSLIILLIGISRIYLGVHYPSDVIGAYTASGLWIFTVIWCYQWLQERKSYNSVETA